MSRIVTIYAVCELTPAFNHVDTSYVKQTVANALNNDNWNVVGLSVNYSASSLSFSNLFQITIQANIDNAFNDEYARQRAQQILSSIQVATNYLVYQTNTYPLFASVNAKLIVNNVTDNVNQISASGVNDSQSAIKNLGLDNLLTGAGLTSPIVLGVLAIALFLYLKK